MFWSNEAHWEWAVHPNAREKASFLPENLMPMQESGQLRFIPREAGASFLADSPLGFGILFVDGHTEKQMIPHIPYKGRTVVYMADLLPTVGHIPLPYVMGYDTRPLITLEEKAAFLQAAADEQYVLFLEHDAHNECCTLMHTEKGVRLEASYAFNSLF